jgi:hypothetical protein
MPRSIPPSSLRYPIEGALGRIARLPWIQASAPLQPGELVALGRIGYATHFWQKPLARDLGTYQSTVVDWVSGAQTCRSISALAVLLLVTQNAGIRIYRERQDDGALLWSYAYNRGNRGRYPSPGEAALSALVNAARLADPVIVTTADINLLRLAVPENVPLRLGLGV